ncbi:ran-binding protein 1c-like [Dorcoceras hygrometricum]|uniref:Ran-binding protein 1c-like n=1 Tax=Dorcoceras hygrometricum TaxID=472368 RepID=A0A2Z7CXL8_9LAMI|nr:ran-binding protein 1c-like [Dorcoceras hygrometricum]
MSNVAEPAVTSREEEEEDPHPAAEDEDTGAPVAPIVRLEEVSVVTGEENEEILLNLKAKLYRFDKEGNQWKERGVGTVKLLKDKVNGKVRLVMRQNKTLKICANHLVLPGLSIQEHHGNDKSCVWHAADFADGELKDETFCIRFPSVQDCKTFKDKIEEITESLAQDRGESEEANATASLLENLSVEGKDSKEKPETKESSVESKDSDEKPKVKEEAPLSVSEKKDNNE